MEMKHLSVISWPARRNPEFDPLILLDRKGGYICSEAVSRDMDPKSFLGYQCPIVLSGEVRAGYMGGESIFYSVPVYGVDGAVSEVLVGVRERHAVHDSV